MELQEFHDSRGSSFVYPSLMRWVFLPGLDGTGLLLEPVVASLPSEIRSTLVRYPSDLKGCYQDYAGAAGMDLDTEAPAVVIAESFSGPVAVRLAAANPGVKAIVLSGSFISHPRAKSLRNLLPLLAIGLRLNRTSHLFIRLLLAGMDAPKELIQIVAEAARRVPVKVLVHRLGLALSCDESQAFAKLTIPVLALIGDSDRLVPASYSAALMEIQPRLILRSFPTSHLILERKTEEAIACISHFLARVPGNS